MSGEEFLFDFANLEQDTGDNSNIENTQASDLSSIGLHGVEDLINLNNNNNNITVADVPVVLSASVNTSTNTAATSVGSNGNGSTTIVLKGGRALDEVWSELTKDKNPNKDVKSKCQWCQVEVNHHKKIEEVKRHLKKCGNYHNHIVKETNKMKPAFLKVTEQANTTQINITKFSVPGLTTEEQSQFNYHMSMHYYMTGTAFGRIECKFLLKALQLLRPNLK